MTGIRVWRSPLTGGYYRQRRPMVFEAQALTPSDVEAIEAATVLDEVIGLARPQYRLRRICREVRMERLTARVDIARGLTGQEKVPPMVEAELSAETYESIDFNLWKNVVHVVISDEARMRAAHDILRLHVEDAARELARMENKQIAEELAKAPEVSASGPWDSMTGGVSDYNPFNDLLNVFNTLKAEGYEPDYAVMHPKTWGGFITNTYVRDLVQAGVAALGRESGEFTIPGYPSVRVVVDHAVTPETSCYVLCSTAPVIVLGVGPTEAAQYRDERAGYYAYIIRQWLQPRLIVEEAVMEITGAHS